MNIRPAYGPQMNTDKHRCNPIIFYLCSSVFICGLFQAAEETTPVPLTPTLSPSGRGQGEGAGSPAGWLAHEGKGDGWYKDTEKCRALLAKLDFSSERAKRWQGRIQDRCQMLRRASSFDWKSRTAPEFLEGILEDLLAGKEPLVRYAGNEFGYPYWSNTMERIEALWLHVPPQYDQAKEYQFFMYYKSGGGIHFKDGKACGGYRPTVEAANRTDSFHAWSSLDIQVKGRKGAHIEVAEATAALCRDFSVSPDRIFLSGWSDGGFTAIWVASRYPHLVAGLAPLCSNWQYSNIEDAGLSSVPSLAADGWGDGGYNSGQFCRWLALRSLGADSRCIWGHHGHSYQPYEDVEEFAYIMDWAKGQKRDLYPKKVRYATWNLNWNRAYWFSIERVASPALAALFEAEAAGDNSIRVQVSNVAAYRLALSDKLVDPAKPVTVTTNGKPTYAGPFQADLLIELLPRPAGGREKGFVKDASLPDDIAAAIIESTYASGSMAIPSRRWLSVKPTKWDEKTAGLLAKWLPKDAKADTALNNEDLVRCNLLLYGGPEINELTARIAADLPVKFERGKFTLGATVYDRPSHCVAFLHPNPLNPTKYVIVYAFNDAQTFAQYGFFGMTGGALSEFRTGDCLVMGIPAERRRWGEALDSKRFESRHLLFDASWKVDASPPLGELERPFDYPQILRLKADAVREAAGADVGIIWEHTPSWNRWGDSLPAGPVTLHDLATIDMFPENISVAEMTGAELLRHRPAAWTIVADKRDPSWDGTAPLAASEMDATKTYRVAMGYFGMPSYGAEPDRMPKLFPFATPQDFLATKTNRIPLKNFRQLPLQVIEATAQFIQRHKKVSPRPVCGDLTEYITNPVDNNYGACDWLHLGVEASWGDPVQTGERYTLNLGLVALSADSAERGRAPLSADSATKRFLDLKPPEKLAMSFSDLDKKLPVAVSVSGERHAITSAGAEGFRLAAAPHPSLSPEGRGRGEGDVAARCLLVKVRLVNAGAADIAVTAVLSASALRQIWRQTFSPPDEEDKNFRGYYAGYHRPPGEDRQRPVREDAALFLFAGDVPKVTRLVAPNAGYNFGLAGVSAPLTLKAGQTLWLPLLFARLEPPPHPTLSPLGRGQGEGQGRNASLAQILDSLKAGLLRTTGDE